MSLLVWPHISVCLAGVCLAGVCLFVLKLSVSLPCDKLSVCPSTCQFAQIFNSTCTFAQIFNSTCTFAQIFNSTCTFAQMLNSTCPLAQMLNPTSAAYEFPLEAKNLFRLARGQAQFCPIGRLRSLVAQVFSVPMDPIYLAMEKGFVVDDISSAKFAVFWSPISSPFYLLFHSTLSLYNLSGINWIQVCILLSFFYMGNGRGLDV